MAAVDPPPQITRIVEVMDPGSGHYSVYVRIPPHLALKFPDKPWLTRIESIGLAEKDITKFAGYVLVDIENISDRRVGDTADLFWIFQKLDGPIWTTRSLGQDNLIPAKYHRLVATTVTKQEVYPDTEPSAMEGDLVRSVVERMDNTGKSLKVDTAEDINLDGDPIIGELTDTWGINYTEEFLVEEGEPVEYGFGVKRGTVVPFGNGTSVAEVELYPHPESPGVIYTLEGQETDELTGVIVDIDKALVDADKAKTLAAAQRVLGYYTELQPVDKWHTIMISSKLNGDPGTQIWTETQGLSLPDRLTEVGVIWDSSVEYDGGSSGVNNISTIELEGYSWNVSAEAAIIGNVMGRPYTLVNSGYRGNGEVTVTRTFHYGPVADPIAIDNIQGVNGTVTIRGTSKAVSAQANMTGVGDISMGENSKVKFSRDDKLVIFQFGPVLHSGIGLTHAGDDRTISDQVTASGGSVPGGGNYPAAVATIDITGSATLSMPASSAPKISGDTYILHVEMKPWRFGWWIREVYTVKVP